MSDDRTIALRSQTPPDVTEMAGLIKAMLPNGAKLTDQEALAGAMYGKAHGLNPFKGEYYIIPGKGVFPGYRGEMRMQDAREYYTQTRPLRSDEAGEHEIAPGDTARIVELYQPDLMARMRTMGVQYQPILGVGIVRRSEKYKYEDWVGEYPNKKRVKLDPPQPIDPPTGRSWAWKAEQRALKDAMRHMQGGADILDETVQDHLDDAEQHADAIMAEVRNLPPAEQQAQFTARVNAMRGESVDAPSQTMIVQDAYQTGVKDGATGFATPEPSADAEFRRLTSAAEERNAPAHDEREALIEHPAMASMQLGSQTAQFTTWCAGFVDIFPYYAKNGKPDMAHIMRAVASENFAAVTPDNLDAVCKALEARAERKVAGK